MYKPKELRDLQNVPKIRIFLA